MKKRLLCLCLSLLLLCPAFSGAESVGDSIIFGMISSKTYYIDPLLPVEREMISIYNEVYESLVQVDDQGLPQPRLAESWTETNGGKNWTFTLRDDVVFSDGTPLTAYDVEATGNFILQTANNESSPDRGFYRNMTYTVDSFQAKDEHTLTVKAKRPYYGLLYCMTFPVVKQSEVGAQSPVGTGPYMITSFEPGSYLLLSANPSWWQTKPQVQEITCMFFPNNKEMITAYEYGQVDAVFTRSVAAAQYKSGINALSISYSTRQLEVIMMSERERSYPLDSVNVRRAIRYAINENQLVNNVYMGMTAAADTPTPKDSWLYLDQEGAFVYNPDKARQLLAEEGWADLDGNGVLDKVKEGETEPKHLVLSLYVYEDPDNDVRYESANQVADMLAEVGISVHVETASFSQAQEILKNGSFDMFMCAFQLDVQPDYGFFLYKTNGQNYSRYYSSEMSSLIDSMRKQTGQADFYQTSQAIQQLFAQDVPFLCLFYRTGAILTRKMYTSVRSIREYELLRGIEHFGR